MSGSPRPGPVSDKDMTRERARLATITQRQAELEAQRASRVVGPTGETLAEAVARLAKFYREGREVDPYERRAAQPFLGTRGPRWGNGYGVTGRRGRAGW